MANEADTKRSAENTAKRATDTAERTVAVHETAAVFGLNSRRVQALTYLTRWFENAKSIVTTMAHDDDHDLDDLTSLVMKAIPDADHTEWVIAAEQEQAMADFERRLAVEESLTDKLLERYGLS